MENTQNSSNDSRENSYSNIEEHKTPLITFAKLNKYFFIPFLCPIFCMLSNYLLLLIDSTKVVKKGEIFVPLFVELSYIFTGFLYFISRFQQKIEGGKEDLVTYNERDERHSSAIKYIYNEGNKKNYLKEWVLIITLGFLVAVFELLSIFIRNKKVIEDRLYFLFFIPLFSKFILKDNILRHQYFSLIIAIVGIIILIIPVCLAIKNKDILPNFINLISGVSYSLFLVLIKYMTHVFYISPFKLSLFFGAISFGFTFLGFFIYSLIDFHNLSYFNNIFDFSEVDNKFPISIYIILTLIFSTILQVMTLLVIFYFSPILLMVTDIISPMLLWFVITIQKGEDLPDVVLNPIGYIIVLFSSLIYNEIIIFNFCNLSNDTKKFIEVRLSQESHDLRKTQNDLGLKGITRSDNESNEDDDEEERLSTSLI